MAADGRTVPMDMARERIDAVALQTLQSRLEQYRFTHGR